MPCEEGVWDSSAISQRAKCQVRPDHRGCLPVDVHVLLHVCAAPQEGAAQGAVGPRVIKSARKGEPSVRDPEAPGGPGLDPQSPGSPIEFSEQEVEGAARRVHQLLQHRDVTASQDLQDTSKASPTQCQLPWEGWSP